MSEKALEFVESKNSGRIALLGNSRALLEQPGSKSVSTINIYSDEIRAAALSNDGSAFAVIVPGTIHNDLYAWRWQNGHQQWPQNGRLVRRLSAETSYDMTWEEAQGLEGSYYPPIGLVITWAQGEVRISIQDIFKS